MEQPDAWLVEHPRNGSALMVARFEGAGQSWQAERRTLRGVVPQHNRVEHPVVVLHQACRSLAVFPHPLSESGGQLLGLLDGGIGLDSVQDALVPLAAVTLDRVVHLDG